MNKIFTYVIILLVSKVAFGQNFVNGDFEGKLASIPGVPIGWQNVPISDIHCRASFRGGTTTDLLDEFGPQKSDGEYGKPYSGKIFLSGLYGASLVQITKLRYQEGIRQYVRGFTIGCEYEIIFYQSVVKQHNAQDNSGSWSIFLDNDSLYTSQPTFSDKPFDHKDLEWEKRSVSFVAKKINYRINFLPQDDDPIFGGKGEFLRMGLDNLSLRKKKTTGHLDLLGPDRKACDGDQIVLSVAQSGSSYLWQDGSISTNYIVTQSGVYWVEVASECGIARDSVYIEFTPLPEVNLGENVLLCEGETVNLGAYHKGATYLWQDGSTNSEFKVTKEGAYWIEVFTECGKVRDSIQVDYVSPPKADIGSDNMLCEEETLTLEAFNVGSTYLWQDGSMDSKYTITQSGLYWVEISNTCGSDRDSIIVEVILLPEVNLGSDVTLCEGETLNLSTSFVGGDYQWQDGSTGSDFVVTKAGLYWIEVSNQCGIVRDSLMVEYQDLPKVNLGEDKVLCIDDELTLDASFDDATYLWHDGSMDEIFEVTDQHEIWVRVSNECGFASDSIQIVHEDCHCSIYMPNTFSPNGDGINDGIVPLSDCDINDYSFQIFDRWGEQVFHSIKQGGKWDGMFRNKRSSPGVYAYLFSYNQSNKGKKVLRGSLTLLR